MTEPERQPELAIELAVVGGIHSFFIGELEESWAYIDAGRTAAGDNGLDDSWLTTGLNGVAMCSRSFSGDFAGAQEFANAISTYERASRSEREVLCPAVLSEAALAAGALAEAAALAAGALEAAGARSVSTAITTPSALSGRPAYWRSKDATWRPPPA